MKKLYFAFAAVLFSAASFAQCTDLFFSEYVEGSSNNKALEIFNPKSVPVSLNGYKVQLYANGNTTPVTTLSLSGTIAAGDVYLIVNSGANDSIKVVKDTTSAVTNFNGNDAVVLLKGTDTLDVIGIVGNDPGAGGWAVGSGFTTDKTLVRADTVHDGTKNWALSSTQWVVLPKDTIRLGYHSMTQCNPITDTLVQFSPTSAQVSESSGTYDLSLVLNAASLSSTFSVDVVLTGGTGDATDINNYTTQTVTFNPTTATKVLTLTITDDLLPEGAETLVFTLRNSTGALKIGADSVFTLTIGASDIAIQPYTISQITGLDANNSPDSLGVKVRVTGTVLGIDYRNNGVEFFIHDATDGVLVFSPANSFGYTVAEGDSVLVEGEVGFFNGTTEVQFLDTIIKIGTGTVSTPLVVQDLDETTEAELVRLNNVTLVTPSQWTGTGASGFSCDITDGQNTWKLRIDEMCALYSQPAPTGTFDVIGIGSQNDNTSPYTSGYQLLPRFTSDIILHSGITEAVVGSLKVYPNPNNGQFVVQTKTAIANGALKIYDVAGRVVYTNSVNGAQTVVNASELTFGLYVVEILDSNTVYRTRLNIQK
jgi:predicted extracellular nuclease